MIMAHHVGRTGLGSLAQQSLAACLDAVTAFHRLLAFTSYVPFLAAIVANGAFRALLWPCSHMHLSRSLVSLILVWYATTVVAPQ